MNDRIVVLLSSYNGEKYIKEQIDSILQQADVSIRIIVRDDGSTDGTINILREYKAKGFLDYYTGENLGPVWSFMDLVYKAPDGDFYALADQDDVWDSHKLAAAIARFNTNKPALYYHAMDVVDRNLKSYDYYFRDEKFSKSLEYSCMYGDEIAGCTMVFNRQLLERIKEYKPSFLTMHDGWIHRVCLCVQGDMYADRKAYIHYRQHDSNTVGMKKRRISDRIGLFFHKNPKFSRLALEMLNGYSNYMSSSDKNFIEHAVNYRSIKNRIYMIRKTLSSNVSIKMKNDLIFKLLMNMY